MEPLDSGFLFFQIGRIRFKWISHFGRDISCVYTWKWYTRRVCESEEKGFYIRKKLESLFLKKLCLDKRENENDEYYDYKRSSGYATLSKNAQPPWFDCGSYWNRENRYLKSDNWKIESARDPSISSRYQGWSFRSCQSRTVDSKDGGAL